jgi:hypothetical protein
MGRCRLFRGQPERVKLPARRGLPSFDAHVISATSRAGRITTPISRASARAARSDGPVGKVAVSGLLQALRLLEQLAALLSEQYLPKSGRARRSRRLLPHCSIRSASDPPPDPGHDTSPRARGGRSCAFVAGANGATPARAYGVDHVRNEVAKLRPQVLVPECPRDSHSLCRGVVAKWHKMGAHFRWCRGGA